MFTKRTCPLLLGLMCAASLALAQADGKLQSHYIDVGQGDAAVLISPKGQVVLFDDGPPGHCDAAISYLDQLGVKKIDDHIVSHYHTDHIGCTAEILAAYPLTGAAYDRGKTYPGKLFTAYLGAVGTHRKTAVAGTSFTLDKGADSPVTVSFIALNGAGVSTTNENDLSVVALVQFGGFAAEFGGDLSGFQESSYRDIETPVAQELANFGKIDVYKVHHHCSAYSTNDTWLEITHPRVGIISTGNGNTYHHPTEECLERLHKSGVMTYWTEEGNGATPEAGLDVVAGSVTVQVAPGAHEYTVTQFNGVQQTYQTWAGSGGDKSTATAEAVWYVWAEGSSMYHYPTCSVVKKIKPANLRQGTTPPSRTTLHKNCPQ